MTAQLMKFKTEDENNQEVTVSLFYDKHDMFCVTVTSGDVEKFMPEYKERNQPNLLPALAKYNYQKKKLIVMGKARTETVSSLFDQALDAAKNPAKYEMVSTLVPVEDNITWEEWEGRLYDEIERICEVTRSDAQGMCQVVEDRLKPSWLKCQKPEAVAKLIADNKF